MNADTLLDARQLSRLGEPLRVVIPVRSDPANGFQERCLALASSGQSDGVPHILTANVAVERQGEATQVVVTTAAPVREPVLRLLVRTTCDGATRLYTLFLESAGSTRQVRAVGQPGPRLGEPAASGPSPSANARPAVARSASGVTSMTISVLPAQPEAGPAASLRKTPGSEPATARSGAERPTAAADARAASPVSTPATSPLLGAASPATVASDESTVPRSSPEVERAGTPGPAALEAENLTLKQQLADLAGELQRLQHAPQQPVSASPAGAGQPLPPVMLAPRWESAWPVLVALAGLAAVVVGGLMWRRRHTGEEWPLTGPPSHRVASRTSLAEEPVPFKQAGVRIEGDTIAPMPEVRAPIQAPAAPVEQRFGETPPVTLLLQPSAEDLGRELEQELFIAERAHSALERAHPEIVDLLTRSWGTAVARHQLAALLQAGSAELARMSGEAVAELRLLLRIAEDHLQRRTTDCVGASSYSPPAPAW